MILDGLKLFEKDFKLRSQIEMLLVEWKKMCPSVDVEDQIRWAHFWLQNKVAVNATNMKKDLIRFLANWMKGEEQRNRERRQGDRRVHPKYVEQKPPEDEVMTGEDFKKMREALQSPGALQ